MKANIKGALERINKYWHLFEHRGRSMSKNQVKSVLEYGLKKGYTVTSEFSDEEVDEILKNEIN